MDKEQGKIVHFHTDKKFGFIQYRGNKEIFFHQRQFRAGRTPIIGEMVVFEITKDKAGRDCADNVQELAFVQKQQAKRQKHEVYQERQEQKLSLLNAVCGFAVMYLVIITALSWMTKMPRFLPVCYVVLSVVSFLMYHHDKQSAYQGRWRTPESSLHLIDVFGGWIGASFAHRLLDHKATKADFRAVFYATIILHIVGVVGAFALI